MCAIDDRCYGLAQVLADPEPALGFSVSTRAEPEIRQTLDRTGQTWWKVYDPLTGHTAYLESEAEVQIWLEERLYH